MAVEQDRNTVAVETEVDERGATALAALIASDADATLTTMRRLVRGCRLALWRACPTDGDFEATAARAGVDAAAAPLEMRTTIAAAPSTRRRVTVARAAVECSAAALRMFV